MFYTTAGKEIIKVVPLFRLLSAEMVPWCASTMDLAMLKPRPNPLLLRALSTR
jgi:hypothetical protein